MGGVGLVGGCESIDYRQVASTIQSYLDAHCRPHRFRVVCLVDYGSRSRGEGGVFSDVDLAVLVISQDALCGNLLGHEDMALAQDIWGNLPIVRDEYWKNAIVNAVQTNRDWWPICPTSEIYDARAIALSLARGGTPQPLTVASGKAYWDPEGVHSHLKYVLRRGGLRPVLSKQLVEELIARSGSGRRQMHDDLGKLRLGPPDWPEEPPIPRIVYGVYLWLKPAVQCIREMVGAWSLVEQGWPEWRRKHVLRFISGHDPGFYQPAREAYFYKSTLRGRARFRRLAARNLPQILGHIETITTSIDSFWQRATAATRDREEGLDATPHGVSRRFLEHTTLQTRT